MIESSFLGQECTVILLIENGADPNVGSYQDKSALLWAIGTRNQFNLINDLGTKIRMKYLFVFDDFFREQQNCVVAH